MRLRFSRVLGTPVTGDDLRHSLGTISGVLIHPETGAIEGFFVQNGGFLFPSTLFLSSAAIRHWGTRVRIADEDALCPIDDVVRCRSLLESGQVILGQRMMTEDGVRLGRCVDMQFSSETFQVEWLFPRQWFRQRPAVAFRDVVEVRKDVIIIRSGAVPVEPVPAALGLQVEPS
jgi:uncharacterized protein YrrD